MQHLAVAFACGEAFCRSSDSAAVLDDLAVGFVTATITMQLRGCERGRSRFLFVGGTVSGALTGSVTVTVTGAVAISKKKSLDLFSLAGQFNLMSQLDLEKEAPEQSLCCTRNFAVVIFFLADTAFSKLVAGRI